MMNSLDLNVASPEELPQVLRRAADVFRESHERDIHAVYPRLVRAFRA